LEPNETLLLEQKALGLIATAPGDRVDFVSRFFAPKAGIFEDPVTGSAHCVSTPYWAERLGKQRLIAHQISKRGGELRCTLRGERVDIAGHAVLYMRGDILV
jgi:predicted PhzF superfamily epimerase YddE/YHI9